MNFGKQIITYAEKLSKLSEQGNGLTRLYLSKEHKQAIELLSLWMKKAGLETSIDDAGNIIGKYTVNKNAPTLLLGSHQDSVRHGGKFDGMLGIIVPIVCMQKIKEEKIKLSYNIEIIGFGDEEGTRFGTAYLSSSTLTGGFSKTYFEITDSEGITLKNALINFGLKPEKIVKLKRQKEGLIGYIEIHIEQGPILEQNNLPIGIVSAINISSRYNIKVEGEAGHAGTVPMKYRHDAGTAASEIITSIENIASNYNNVVATVGQISFKPNSINVIPSEAIFSLDLRSDSEKTRKKAFEEIENIIGNICKRRKVSYSIDEIFLTSLCKCNSQIIDYLKEGISNLGITPYKLSSGAGHDAQEMSKLTKVGMMFVRCKKGISHSPDESITQEDADTAARALIETLKIIDKSLKK